MSNRAVFQDIVDRTYAARAADDVEGVVALFHPDATFQLAGAAEASPAAMTATGASEIRARIIELTRAWTFVDQTQLSFVVDGDQAAVHTRFKMRFKPSGETVTTEFHDLWTIRDGKIASLVQFVDTAMVNAVIGRAQANGFLPKSA